MYTLKSTQQNQKEKCTREGIQNKNDQIFQLLKNNPEILFELIQ